MAVIHVLDKHTAEPVSYTHLDVYKRQEQQYLPDAIKDVKYYTFGDNKNEQAARAYWAKICLLDTSRCV